MYRCKVWVLKDIHEQKLIVFENNEADTWFNKISKWELQDKN
jgi:putative SOS response-associated peptidase YedK